MDMELPSLSSVVAMKQAQIQRTAQISVVKKGQDVAKQQGAALIAMIQKADLSDGLGGSLDVRG